MSMHSERFPQMEGASKEDRRQTIVDEGILENRRFLLSFDPVMRERMAMLRKQVEDLKTDMPIIISAQIEGSLVKGYATPESDLDVTFLIDRERIPEADRKMSYEYDAQGLDRSHYTEVIRRSIKEALGLSDEQVGHISVTEIQPEGLSSLEHIWPGVSKHLFSPSISRDIVPYRKKLLETLEREGEAGEAKWKEIIDRLWHDENIGFDDELQNKRKKLYPQTIDEAKAYFLRGEGSTEL